jgi:cytochrome P450
VIDRAFLDDPYPFYSAWRSEGPVVWHSNFCGGAWLLTGYDDVAGALRDPRYSARRAGGWANSSGPQAHIELIDFKRIFSRSLLFLDAPQHTRVRHTMNDGFKPQAIIALRPRIGAIVESLLDSIVERGPVFDFVEEFARPLPALVIAEMLGIDTADRGAFISWSDDIAAFIGAPTPTMEIALRAQVSLVAMNNYFADLLPHRRRHLGEDLVSQLIVAEAAGTVITTKELLAQCCTLLFAGHETTRNLLGNGLLALLQNPGQWQELRDTPSLMRPAMKELLRFDSPVQYTGRRLRVDIELHGRTMKKGDLVVPLIGAANRDPAQFDAPDVLDIRRNQGPHLSFGFGPHVCIGATLTYLEAELAFRAIMERLPGLALAGEAPVWGSNAAYRSLDTLPLYFSSVRECAGVPIHAAVGA